MRVLFLGNSQISWNGFHVPTIVKSLSASAPATLPRVECDEVIIGGCTLEKMWNDGRARKKIAEGGWDRVLCHEIVYAYGGNTARMIEFGRKFAAEAKAVGAQMLFYATGEIESAGRAKHQAMYDDAVTLARECNGRVAGGGMAWLKAWEKKPALDFHSNDRAHPNANGYYLNACVIFSALTDGSPIGLDPFGLGREDAEFLQHEAWAQYADDRKNEKN